MELVIESGNPGDYLAEAEELDYSDPSIRELAATLYGIAKGDELLFVQAAYEYVRDEISHSWDIQASRVTCRASDVLRYRHGICYAKSNLLAAILRSQGVPAGFCYQRLTLGDTPDTGHCIHALNAAYIGRLGKWIRIDARGNKDGIDARFALEGEQLAFPIRAHYDEIDYPGVYANPNPKTIAALKGSTDVLEMYRNRLPDTI
ncbi:transglutaminase-like domain-containing protein [Cohnella panacarvi]|uniref:transglutaminase-like domain-containing protein n=1 Tax=Cohnella panacarvi TaxID=400776 RepID=UPI00047C62CF|nr:transglutaminase family protein [Cohnella panacarvi]